MIKCLYIWFKELTNKQLDHMAKIASKSANDKVQEAKKDKYKVTNWSEYNKSLVSRGSLEIWIEEDAVDNWHYDGPTQRGAQFKFSDECITCLLQLKAVYKLPYRQLEGFINSILKLMEVDLKSPSYTQICRRAESLDVDIEVPITTGPIYLVVDSTGLKVYGDGEWKARKHGITKRRKWRKLHIGVDEKTGYIHAEKLTDNGEGDGDAQQTKELLDQVKVPVDRFSGDGAYDTHDVWDDLEDREVEGIIPPQKNAVYWTDDDDNLLDIQRNNILKKIDQVGREEWKKISDYHRRSLSETTMMRYKVIHGPTLYSRIPEKQIVENSIKIKCLNKMTRTGMPNSVKVAS